MNTTRKLQRPVRRAFWLVPLAGFVATYLLAAGMSLSNVDNRPQVEIAGLLVLAALAVLGFVLTWRAGNPAAGLVVNGVLALLVVVLAASAYLARRPPNVPAAAPAPAEATQVPRPVWIDTDLACGSSKTSDVDDCWALAFALRSPELDVRGISTVFGNRLQGVGRDAQRRADLARAILALARRDVPVFPGNERHADERTWPATAASEAMAAALARSRLTILALGPASNVATLLARHPEAARNIERIVLVAGKPPGRLFHPGRHWWFHFGDFNVAQDTRAMRAVLASGVPITLVPFEVAMQVAITPNELEQLRGAGRLGRWLVATSGAWLSFWQSALIERHGFSPFDALAVGSTAWPELFTCHERHARIGFSAFLEPFGLGRDLEVAEHIAGAPVRYCVSVDKAFAPRLLERLKAESPGR